MENSYEVRKYSVSPIKQGIHRFYTLTIPSDVLAKCCFVSTRYENPNEGFQRLLDEKRAKEIATYIDEGLGTIPCSIILSAQEDAQLEVTGGGKTIRFVEHPKAFLIIDGQHRVYGFSLAKSALRVPVVIYKGLTRTDETRLFIDINSKQKGVPNELLLDIKRLAEYETDQDAQLKDIYDDFMTDPESILLGKCSPSSKEKNKISRVTFNNAVKPLLRIFDEKDAMETYQILNAYLSTFIKWLRSIKAEDALFNTIVFRAIFALFPEAASKLKDRFEANYTQNNFKEILSPVFEKIKIGRLQKPGTSYRDLLGYFTDAIKKDFTI